MLGTAPSLARLTVSACLVGLALGQLVVGVISDRGGRLRPSLGPQGFSYAFAAGQIDASLVTRYGPVRH